MAKRNFEIIAVADVMPYAKNARTHSDEQIQEIANIIRALGFCIPIVIDENGVLIAGHGRIEAAELVGVVEVPAYRISDLTEQQKNALRIADNQLATKAGWDMDLLRAEISDLLNEEFEVELLGFDDEYLDNLMEVDAPPEMPKAKEPEEKPQAQDKVVLLIGPYEIKVSRSEWDKWEREIRAKVGFDINDIKRDIKRRLKI